MPQKSWDGLGIWAPFGWRRGAPLRPTCHGCNTEWVPQHTGVSKRHYEKDLVCVFKTKFSNSNSFFLSNILISKFEWDSFHVHFYSRWVLKPGLTAVGVEYKYISQNKIYNFCVSFYCRNVSSLCLTPVTNTKPHVNCKAPITDQLFTVYSHSESVISYYSFIVITTFDSIQK